jgi:orotate phosphoribosyltransferase
MNPKHHVQTVIKETGVYYDANKIVLANGGTSHYLFDIKQAFSTGNDMLLLTEVLDGLTRQHGMDYDVVGGMELGAVPLAVTMAVYGPAGTKWFAVRKHPKRRGINKLIEGYTPTQHDRVLIVEDVTTTGSTIVRTFEHLQSITNVVGAIAVVDRSDGKAAHQAHKHGFRYAALFTSQELL